MDLLLPFIFLTRNLLTIPIAKNCGISLHRLHITYFHVSKKQRMHDPLLPYIRLEDKMGENKGFHSFA